MLITPLGDINILIDGIKINYEATKLKNINKLWSDINERYLLKYYVNEKKDNYNIQCIISGLEIVGEPESGENLEAISFYKDDLKLTIGINTDFLEEDGRLLDDGLEVNTHRILKIGVCWLCPFTPNNEIQTWYGADPIYM